MWAVSRRFPKLGTAQIGKGGRESDDGRELGDVTALSPRNDRVPVPRSRGEASASNGKETESQELEEPSKGFRRKSPSPKYEYVFGVSGAFGTTVPKHDARNQSIEEKKNKVKQMRRGSGNVGTGI